MQNQIHQQGTGMDPHTYGLLTGEGQTEMAFGTVLIHFLTHWMMNIGN